MLQFRRGQNITIRQVLKPLGTLLFLSVAILTAWTVLDPWTWKVDTIRLVPAETYGQCQCQYFWAFFGPLTALIVAAEFLSAFFAWKTSDVPEDFRDTNSVVYAICTNLQAWFLGIPILAVLDSSSADATYFGRVLLIWIFAVFPLVLVTIPKLYQAYYERKHPEKKAPKHRVTVTGLSTPVTATPNSRTSHMSSTPLGGPSAITFGSSSAQIVYEPASEPPPPPTPTSIRLSMAGEISETAPSFINGPDDHDRTTIFQSFEVEPDPPL